MQFILFFALISPTSACSGTLEASSPALLSIYVTSKDPAAPCEILLTVPKYELMKELLISRDVNITAKNGSVRLQAAPGQRVLSVSTNVSVRNVSVRLKGLVVTGGRRVDSNGGGAGIFNDGTLTLS
jgi:hypothetical protein